MTLNVMRRLLIQLLILYTLCLSSIGFANNLIADYLPEQCHYKGGFEQQQILVTLPVRLISKGTFYSSCENGIVWQTNQPHVSKEALILTRSDTHFRALQNDLDSLEQIESIGINSFASILIAIMQKDDAYLEQTFALDADLQSSTLKLTPLSAFMKKGISVITIEKQATAPIVNITKSNVVDRLTTASN